MSKTTEYFALVVFFSYENEMNCTEDKMQL